MVCTQYMEIITGGTLEILTCEVEKINRVSDRRRIYRNLNIKVSFFFQQKWNNSHIIKATKARRFQWSKH